MMPSNVSIVHNAHTNVGRRTLSNRGLSSGRSRGDGRSGTQSIERAFAVLKEVSSASSDGVSLAVLVRKMGLNRTTIFRIIKCLISQNAMRYDGAAKRYFLGPLAFEFGIAARHQQLDLRTLCSPALARIAQATGDTVFLMRRNGDDSVCVDRWLGSYPIKTLVAEIGTQRPLGIGAGGLAILSALPEPERSRIVRDNGRRLAAFGASAGKLLTATRRVAEDGYVSLPVHGLKGVISIGVPVLDPAGKPVAALSVTAIAERMTRMRQREVAAMLRSEAAHLQLMLETTGVT